MWSVMSTEGDIAVAWYSRNHENLVLPLDSYETEPITSLILVSSCVKI